VKSIQVGGKTSARRRRRPAEAFFRRRGVQARGERRERLRSTHSRTRHTTGRWRERTKPTHSLHREEEPRRQGRTRKGTKCAANDDSILNYKGKKYAARVYNRIYNTKKRSLHCIEREEDEDDATATSIDANDSVFILQNFAHLLREIHRAYTAKESH